MRSLLDLVPPCRRWQPCRRSGDPSRRGPEGKLELTAPPERISEGFHPAQFGKVASRSGELKHLRVFSTGDDYDTSVKSSKLNRKD